MEGVNKKKTSFLMGKEKASLFVYLFVLRLSTFI
ncbi:hypothetical protein IUSA1_01735 [Streptococcus iniae IUSA1]|nr:hypothetical protein IUSA1_01735 [Streptococcus iniae IUSA1]